MRLEIKHNERVLSSNILTATDPISRVVGLMFGKAPKGDGLLLEPCNSIHTFFMRYSLDVVFLNRSNEVVKVIRNLRPWRITWIYLKARKTLELPAGRLAPEIGEGARLEIRNV